MMPTATMMRMHDGDFKSIVAGVLKIAPEVEAGRQHTINTPSVIRAEFTREIEELDRFRQQINQNIRAENTKTRKSRTIEIRRGDVFQRIRKYSKYTLELPL